MLLLLRPQIALVFVAVVNAGLIFVDDRDPHITYEGIWTPSLEQNAYNGTVTEGDIGAAASFSFTGTAISVYATRGPTGNSTVNSSYVIDEGPILVNWEPYTNDINQGLYSFQFFSSGPLPDVQHTLLITNLDYFYWLDYLAVNISDSTPNSNNFSSSTRLSSTSSSDPSSGTSQASLSSSAASRSSVSPGIIAGVAVAGGMLFVSLLMYCWWFRRCRARIEPSPASREIILQGNQTLPTMIEPYTTIPNTSQQPLACVETLIPQRQPTLSAVFPTHVETTTHMETPGQHPPPAHAHDKRTTVREPNIPPVQTIASDEIIQNQASALSSLPSPWRDIPRGARQPRDGGVHNAGGSGVLGTYIFDSEDFSEEEPTLPPSYTM